MNASEVATVGAMVTVLTQILKRALPGEGYSVYIAGAASLLVVGVWVVSGSQWPPARVDLWALFSGWLAVFATAAGIHGISTIPTRAADLKRERVRRVRDAGTEER